MAKHRDPMFTCIRVCDAVNIDSTTYIHPCYSLDYALNTYSRAFTVPKSESLWRDPMVSCPKPDTQICDYDRHANIKFKPDINKNQLNF